MSKGIMSSKINDNAQNGISVISSQKSIQKGYVIELLNSIQLFFEILKFEMSIYIGTFNLKSIQNCILTY